MPPYPVRALLSIFFEISLKTCGQESQLILYWCQYQIGVMVKLITKNTDYAVRALMTLASDRRRFFSAKEIAKIQEIPYPYLRRILQILTKNALIESKEGAGGGVRLKASPSRIHVSELIGMFQGDIELGECLVKGRICSNRDTCVLRHEIKRIDRMIQDEFGKITIHSLMSG